MFLIEMKNLNGLPKIFFFFLSIVFFLKVSSVISYAGGQSNETVHYTVDQGLSSNIVNSICQDENGFIWFGTNEGLNRFDGYNIEVIKNPAPDSVRIKSDFLRQVIFYSKDKLFLAAQNGVYEFDSRKYSFGKIFLTHSRKFSVNRQTKRIYRMLKLRNGKLLISTSSSLFEYDHAKERAKDLLKENKYKVLREKTIKNLA